MYRTNFYHYVIRRNPTTDLIEPLENVQANLIRKIEADGTEEGTDSPIYQNRTGALAGDSFSNAQGLISFWLDPGDYNIYITDTTVFPKRVADSVVGVNAVSGQPEGIQLGQLALAIQDALIPSGTIVATGRTTMPGTGWLLCDGASYLRTTYPALFAAIGTNYGSVSGTTFNIPDLRGRVAVGADGAAGRISGPADAVGEAGGEDIHLLDTDEMPSHDHNMRPYAGVRVLTTLTDSMVVAYGVAATGSPSQYAFATEPSSGIKTSVDPIFEGGGEAHNNMPPYQIINHMIKT